MLAVLALLARLTALRSGERPGSAQGDAGYRPGCADSILCSIVATAQLRPARSGTDYRTYRRWPAAWFRSLRLARVASCSSTRIRRLADRPYPGRIELAALAVLYGVYELVRGFGSENWVAARAHTADIVALERHLNVFVEQRRPEASRVCSRACPRCSASSTSRSISRAPAAALIWVHRRRPHAFPFLRTTLIVSTALALAGYVLYPAAPPRLAEPRLRRHRQHAHGPEPQLRPARQPLQPDRGRAQPPLRLLADRRRRARAARLDAARCGSPAPRTPR